MFAQKNNSAIYIENVTPQIMSENECNHTVQKEKTPTVKKS